MVQQELELLQRTYQVDTLFFQNKGGAQGAFQFLLSIWNVFAGIQLREKIRSFQPDVIHVHNWHFASGAIVLRVAKKMGVSVVHTIHNYRLLCPSGLLLINNELFTESLTQKFPWRAVFKRAYRVSILQTFWLAFIIWFHKKIGTWNMVDKYICLTPFAIEIYKNSTLGVKEEKFITKPNFTYLFNDLDHINREDHFLFIGRLSEEKGIRLLLNAFQGVSAKLKIAGSGPLEHLVLETCNKNRNIEFIGNLEKKGVVLELKRCTALVFPSIWFEGMPLTIIESFSCSTPVIASNLGAMSSMIVDGENGLHFNPNDLEDFKNKIDKWKNLNDSQKAPFYLNAFDHYKMIYSEEMQNDFINSIYLEVTKN
jgi:glycosyltransferase involved in cell wall biosynthesis